ncbi:MAG: peptidase S10, partial [Saprospiraceae bacterium]|nr:peptidase S10 [Saprospiraceae bacterium]
VFIDPVGTGYSKVVGKGKVEQFWGLKEDARSIAQFIRMWVTKYKRWNAPKYLAGESFGTTRAAGVSYELMSGGQDMALNGIIMISQALDYAGSTSEHDNITSYFTYLPAMAATAWYHKKAGQDKSLTEFTGEARQFAYHDYAPALYKGNWIEPEFKKEIIERLHYFTSLDTAYIRRSNLRILVPRFQKELLRSEGLTIGRLDGRYKSKEADLVSERPTLGDPASYSISSAYTAALQQYFADDLKITMDRPYLTGNAGLYPKWNWKPVPKSSGWEPSYVNTARQLGDAMRKNTDLKVIVLSGYYDLITPFFDAEYTFTRNGIITDRVEFKYYEGGHMMYTHKDDLPRVCMDIRNFLK